MADIAGQNDMHTIGYTWKSDWLAKPRIIAALDYNRRLKPNRSSRICHNYWVIDCIRSGGVSVRVGSPRAPWRERLPGVSFLYPPGTAYWEDTTTCASRTLSAGFVIFRDAEVVGLERLITPGHRHATFTDPEGFIAERIRQVAEIGQTRQESGFTSAQAVLFDLLDGLLCSKPGHRDERVLGQGATSMDNLAAKVERFFKSRMADKITLKLIAKHLNMSESALSHRYRDEVGEPPMTTLQRMRIAAAKSLMLRGYTLDAVAEQTGFYDAFHLSKTFKRLEGMPPRRFVLQARMR